MSLAGTAFIQIVPDFTVFNRDLAEHLKPAVKAVDGNVNEQGLKSTASGLAVVDGAMAKGTKSAVTHASAVKKVGDAWIAAGTSMQSAGAKMSSVGSSLSKVSAPLAAAAAGAVYLDMKFSAAMEQLHTQAGYSQSAVDSLSKSVLAAAPGLATMPESIAQGLYHIASVGIPASKAMADVSAAAIGANISGANFNDTANTLATTMKNFPDIVGGPDAAMAELNAIVGAGNLHLQDLNDNLGKVVPIAKAFGLTLRDVGAGEDVMTSHGMNASQAETCLKMAITKMGGAPTSAMSDMLHKIGLSGTQLATDMRGPDGLGAAVTDLETHLARLGNTTQDNVEKAQLMRSEE